MNSYRLLWTVLLITTFYFSASASVVVFRTYDDFFNKKGIEYDDYKHAIIQMGRCTLTLTKGGKEEKVKCVDIWGFTYQDKLFRVDRFGAPVLLYNQGKICYWENGTSHMEAMRKGKEEVVVSSGFFNHISHSINSPIQELTWGMGQIKKEVNAFIAEQPETQSLFDCIGKVNDWQKTRDCVKTFEGK